MFKDCSIKYKALRPLLVKYTVGNLVPDDKKYWENCCLNFSSYLPCCHCHGKNSIFNEAKISRANTFGDKEIEIINKITKLKTATKN